MVHTAAIFEGSGTLTLALALHTYYELTLPLNLPPSDLSGQLQDME